MASKPTTEVLCFYSRKNVFFPLLANLVVGHMPVNANNRSKCVSVYTERPVSNSSAEAATLLGVNDRDWTINI